MVVPRDDFLWHALQNGDFGSQGGLAGLEMDIRWFRVWGLLWCLALASGLEFLVGLEGASKSTPTRGFCRPQLVGLEASGSRKPKLLE